MCYILKYLLKKNKVILYLKIPDNICISGTVLNNLYGMFQNNLSCKKVRNLKKKISKCLKNYMINKFVTYLESVKYDILCILPLLILILD